VEVRITWRYVAYILAAFLALTSVMYITAMVLVQVFLSIFGQYDCFSSCYE
jgi:hypothetical protein